MFYRSVEIYLIRHTTPDIAPGICYGQSDIPVKTSFSGEVARMRMLLPGQLDAVYTSPLIRCLALAQELSPEPQRDERLMEMHFGDWEMKKWEEISLQEMDPWMKNFVEVKAPGGENFSMLAARAGVFLDECTSQTHSRVAVVTHAGVIRALLAKILGMPLQNAFKLPVHYASVTRLNLNNDTCFTSLDFLNRT